jgi:simple sugar transport system permease protein
MSIEAFLVSFFTPDLLAAAVRIATPIALAAIGAVICERSGVINIALEGKILMGAFVAVAVAHATGSAIAGLAAAIVSGGLVGLTMAFGALTLRANQVVLGAAINIFAAGLTGFLTTEIFDSPGASARVPGFDPISIPGLSDIPWLGTIFFSHTPLVYAAILLAIIGHFFMFRSPWGVWIRAAGDRPLALHSAGVNVVRTRYCAVIIAGCLAAIAGAHLSLEVTHHFSVNMSGGRGFIALAANIFGKWTALGGAAASLLFGFAEALKLKAGILHIPPEILLMLPFILTLVVLVGVMGRATAPRALGQRYDPGSE